ncbi:MAG: hypothetical protein EZS28_035943 [Streblomastix strix]|uniref:Uncharacterized protein n=1 Tax=Streblomastix strix TaxID=222440 RepID=A0A5J4UEJ8_9EUKA|nr:MAG: hypothetical protein EZS28_035943 [Streblomastix strix]
MTKAFPHINPSEKDIEILGQTFTHTKENQNASTILFLPVIESGIHRFEVQNENSLTSIGLVKHSLKFGPNEVPSKYGQENVVEFQNDGKLHHLGNIDKLVKGNDEFKKIGDNVALEV